MAVAVGLLAILGTYMTGRRVMMRLISFSPGQPAIDAGSSGVVGGVGRLTGMWVAMAIDAVTIRMGEPLGWADDACPVPHHHGGLDVVWPSTRHRLSIPSLRLAGRPRPLLLVDLRCGADRGDRPKRAGCPLFFFSLLPSPEACKEIGRIEAHSCKRSAHGTDDLSLALFDGAPPVRGGAADGYWYISWTGRQGTQIETA